MDYWGFWNAVDWLSILCGFVLLALWWHMSSLIGTDLREQIDRLPQVRNQIEESSSRLRFNSRSKTKTIP